MYECTECGSIFDEHNAGTYTERHMHDGEQYAEIWMACPECGGTDLAEIGSCAVCGDPTRDDLCADCRKDIEDALDQILSLGKTERAREAILDQIQEYMEEHTQ